MRLLGACAEAIAERGYAQTTSAAVARLAGISPSTFYRHFSDLPTCAASAYALAADCLYQALAEACEDSRGEHEQLPLAMEAAIRFALAEPTLARLLGPAMPWSVEAVVEARARLYERIAALAGVNQLLIAAVSEVISGRVGSHPMGNLLELGPELAQLLERSYVREIHPRA